LIEAKADLIEKQDQRVDALSTSLLLVSQLCDLVMDYQDL
jgi:hypothetical protein